MRSTDTILELDGSLEWWESGQLPNYSNYHYGRVWHNRVQTLGGVPKWNVSSTVNIRSIAARSLCYIQHYFKERRWASTELEPNWTAASSTVRFVAVISKLSVQPAETVFFHQPHLDLTGLSPNSPFGPIIHDRRGGHYGIKGKAWNPKEAITLGFNCVSSKCQSTPDVWESSASL